MPFEVEKDGKTIKVWTQEEVDAEVKGLKVTNENLKAEKQEALDKAKESRETARQAEEAKAKAEGDKEALERIAEEREAEKRQAVEEERKRFSDLVNMTKKEKVDNFLTSILDEVNTADDVSRRHLRKLLKADYEFDVDLEKGEFSVRGDSVASVDDLKKLLREGDEYKRYLAGSGSSGGGAAGSRGTGGAFKKPDEYSEQERIELYKQDPDKFREIFKPQSLR